MSVGKKIKFIRQQKKVTQKELARRSGLAEITIREYEADKYKPKIENIWKISDALAVSAWELLEDSAKDLQLEYISTQNSYLVEKFKDKYSILKFIESIYGSAQEWTTIFGDNDVLSRKNDFYDSESFYLIQKDKNKTILTDKSFNKITDIMKKTLVALIDAEGITETEYNNQCIEKSKNGSYRSDEMYAVNISLEDFH